MNAESVQEMQRTSRHDDDAARGQLDLFPERISLESCDRARNRFRFYNLSLERDLFGSWCLIRHWGRIGSAGHLRSDVHASHVDVQNALATIARQKLRRGYSDKSR